jgi:hypothetical protein
VRRPPDLAGRLGDQRAQPLAAGVDDLEELAPHARLPEIVDVFGYAVGRLGGRHGLEKASDLVGHVDELVLAGARFVLRRHSGWLRS